MSRLLRPKLLSSAEYLCERPVFFDLREDDDASRVDRYADSILLGIAYGLDEAHPLSSSMRASYYKVSYRNANENLLAAVRDDLPAGQQYIRYWHGSAVLVRLFHLIGDIKGMYLWHAFLLAALVIWLGILLAKRRWWTELIGVLLSLAAVSPWYVPCSLEYTWTFLLMLAASIAAVRMICRGREQHLGVLLLVTGMCTSYLDFLTTELLTCLVPLLLSYRIMKRRSCGNTADAGHSAVMPKPAGHAAAGQETAGVMVVRCTLLWGIGYVLMWIMKWITAALVLQENVIPYVWEHVEERMGGSVGVPLPQFLLQAVGRNVGCLLSPLRGRAKLWLLGALLFVLAYVCYVYHRKNVDRRARRMFLLLGSLPYVRFLLLHNHAWIHYFFTFRVQAAAILALWFLLWEVIEIPMLRHRKHKR